MSTYNIREAKTRFSKLIESVQQGEEVIISKAGKPIAILGPIKKDKVPCAQGLLKGQIHLGSEFDEILPVEAFNANGCIFKRRCAGISIEVACHQSI